MRTVVSQQHHRRQVLRIRVDREAKEDDWISGIPTIIPKVTRSRRI